MITKVSIEFNTDNAAFDFPESEIGCILRQLADRIERKALFSAIRDSNGNTVGKLTITEKEGA
jgi:hypothetical protein